MKSRWSLILPAIVYAILLYVGIYYRLAFLGFWGMLCGMPLLMLIYMVWRFIVYRKHILSTIIALLLLIASQATYVTFVALACGVRETWLSWTPFFVTMPGGGSCL